MAEIRGIDTSFEKILFENAPKDPVQQAAENADAANKASAQAHKDANKAQAKSNAANNLAAEVLGLKQGETLKPADILAKLKADPSILDKIAGNGNLLGLLKTSKESILALLPIVFNPLIISLLTLSNFLLASS